MKNCPSVAYNPFSMHHWSLPVIWEPLLYSMPLLHWVQSTQVHHTHHSSQIPGGGLEETELPQPMIGAIRKSHVLHKKQYNVLLLDPLREMSQKSRSFSVLGHPHLSLLLYPPPLQRSWVCGAQAFHVCSCSYSLVVVS